MLVIGQQPESENVINLHPPNTLLGLENVKTMHISVLVDILKQTRV